MTEFINPYVVFDPTKENTGKSYKITAVTAQCRYYRAKGYYKYTDTIDEEIGEACDRGEKYLTLIIDGSKIDDEIANFLIEHYRLVKFETNMQKKYNEKTGEIFYEFTIRWKL